MAADPGATTSLAAEFGQLGARWRDTGYRRWQGGSQLAEPGPRSALLRLALALLLQPRLAEDAPAGSMDLPGEVVADIAAAVEGALRFSVCWSSTSLLWCGGVWETA
jgi:hypothetical protein